MIDRSLLDRVAQGVHPALAFDDLAQRLRAAFPDVHITVCSEDDVPPRLPPAAENERCALYYVDASEHCLKLTSDAEAASGIVVALRCDD
ncbi:MAG TPA: DUF6129 family protein [Rhodocyclaceae bacterium]